MTPEERAQCLRKEADEVLETVHLKEHCAPIGKTVPTGSYFLDLMKLVEYDCVKEIVFQKGGPGDLAEGFYLKPVVEHGSWERPWKIDIWSLPLDIVEKKQKELSDIKDRMTPVHRRLILEYKYSILTEKKRTPMFSGIYIYRAVMNLGLKDFNEITEHLRENGINI